MDKNNITYTHLFTKDLKDAFEKKEGSDKRVYAVMEFNTEFELGISCKPYEWVNSHSFVTLDGEEALALYVASENPMVEILGAHSFDELNKKMIKLTNNFKNPEFVNNKVESRFY
jgi:hypothetical protein